MNFTSDTAAPAHPAIVDALVEVNTGKAASYGGDDGFGELERRLQDLFETRALAVWPVASGTAANALALASLCGPTEGVLCHRMAHIHMDERGAPEFFTGGAKLLLLEGEHGRIDAVALKTALARINREFVHETPPALLSLTNLTEMGTRYGPAAVSELAGMAKAHGLSVHLDGARFGNALAGCGASPAEMSWKAGVDVMSFGLTKTGAMGCELILLFGEAAGRIAHLRALAKRAGHMPAKMRYLSAQANALLKDGLWLDLSASANRSATRLAEGLCALPGAHLAAPVEGNEIFVHLPEGLAARLRAAGLVFYDWPDGSCRFVCDWALIPGDIDSAVSILASA